MFESHYTHQFFRLWGAKEAALGIQSDSVLLGNSQNDFDSKFGDLTGAIGCRFVLIEFKRNRSGIADEVREVNKPHRFHLYQHLREDVRCRRLSVLGHFAGYPDEHGQLMFEQYAHAVAEKSAKADIVTDRLMGSEPFHELNYAGSPIGFDSFYDYLNELDEQVSDLFSGGVFKAGLGLPMPLFEEYVNCMYAHLHEGVSSDGSAVLGIISGKTKKFVSFGGTLEELIEDLYEKFEQMRKATQLSAASMQASSANRLKD